MAGDTDPAGSRNAFRTVEGRPKAVAPRALRASQGKTPPVVTSVCRASLGGTSAGVRDGATVAGRGRTVVGCAVAFVVVASSGCGDQSTLAPASHASRDISGLWWSMLTGITQGTSAESLENGHYTLTYVNNFRLIGPGPGNNLLVHETAHLTTDGDDVVAQHDDFSIECK